MKVVPLNANRVNQDTIECLEEALAEARAGNIKDVSVAIVRSNGAINYKHSSSESVGALIGALSYALHCLMQDAE